jgi:hypothetical protein
MIPFRVKFIDGSAFCSVNLSSYSIESGNEIFIIQRDLLIDNVHHKLIRSFSTLSIVSIPFDIEILGPSCFESCKSLASVTFAHDSRIRRIESLAFSNSSLRSITIPSGVEILGSSCFAQCKSLTSISFESDSCLKSIYSFAFPIVDLGITIPSSILFIADAAIRDFSHVSLSEGDSCPEFDRWRHQGRRGINLPFRRIVRSSFDALNIQTHSLDLTAFAELSVIGRSDRHRSQLYRRLDDGKLIVVRSLAILDTVHSSTIHCEMENLVQLRHPLIAVPVGFVFPFESSVPRELKIARLWADCGSLADVLAAPPSWWTSTMKAKTIAGIALALRFAHSFGLLHGGLKASNVLFDSHQRILITDFSPVRLVQGDGGGFSGEQWAPIRDISAFVSLVFEMLVGRPMGSERCRAGKSLPDFVSELIEAGQPFESNKRRSFTDLFEILRRHGFRIDAGVDSEEVCRFVHWIEKEEKSAE